MLSHPKRGRKVGWICWHCVPPPTCVWCEKAFPFVCLKPAARLSQNVPVPAAGRWVAAAQLCFMLSKSTKASGNWPHLWEAVVLWLQKNDTSMPQAAARLASPNLAEGVALFSLVG